MSKPNYFFMRDKDILSYLQKNYNLTYEESLNKLNLVYSEIKKKTKNI